MEGSILKEKLHEYIETADEQHLNILLRMLKEHIDDEEEENDDDEEPFDD